MTLIQILFSILMFTMTSIITFHQVLAADYPVLAVEKPQQVHISLSGKEHMRISWISLSASKSESIVHYGKSARGGYTHTAKGTKNTYHYLGYTSGDIHNVIIGPLTPNTSYYYSCASNTSQQYSFKTPPSTFPIKFAVVGDLGQTKWSTATLNRVANSKYDVLLLPGDVSYARRNQAKWDRFGNLVQPQASRRPWMLTHGNHDEEKINLLHGSSFTAYNARWAMPHEESGSPSNHFYSFESAGVHVIMLGSYTDFGPGSDQFRWLQADLKKVDRKRTPWLVAVMHAPWYNSNADHQKELACVGMKQAMEDLLFHARTDVVFSGHVHAYERFGRVYKEKANECGPVYITIGTGGNNNKGVAKRFLKPQPKISAFRDAAYGYGQFSIVNASVGEWTWHRNTEDSAVASDKVFIKSLASIPACLKL